MSQVLVVGYFTVNTPYEGEAEVLKLSLDAQGIPHDIRGVPNLGSWQKNTQHKARFIREMMREHHPRPLVYLDVDAIVVQQPVLLLEMSPYVDVAAVHYAKTKELLSGTVYFSNSGACKEVVKRWIELNELYPETLPNGKPAWDQRTLALAIKDVPRCRFQELPQEYTWITELTQKYMPGLSPVIIHTRGAKRFKNIIDHLPGFAL